MKNKNIVIFGLLALIILSVGATIFYLNNTGPESPERATDESIVETITSENEFLLQDGKPVFRLTSVSVYENKWYVVTLSSLKEVENKVPVRVILLDTGGASSQLRIMAGPDIFYSEQQVAGLNLPDEAILELLQS